MKRRCFVRYAHYSCLVDPDVEWDDEYESACDSECPACGQDIEAVSRHALSRATTIVIPSAGMHYASLHPATADLLERGGRPSNAMDYWRRAAVAATNGVQRKAYIERSSARSG